MLRHFILPVVLLFAVTAVAEVGEGSNAAADSVQVVLLSSHEGNHHHRADWHREVRRVLERAGYSVVLGERLIGNDRAAMVASVYADKPALIVAMDETAVGAVVEYVQTNPETLIPAIGVSRQLITSGHPALRFLRPPLLLEENLQAVIAIGSGRNSIAMVFDRLIPASEIQAELDGIRTRMELPELRLLPVASLASIEQQIQELPSHSAVVILRIREEQDGTEIPPAAVARMAMKHENLQFFAAGFVNELPGIQSGQTIDLNNFAQCIAQQALEALMGGTGMDSVEEIAAEVTPVAATAAPTVVVQRPCNAVLWGVGGGSFLLFLLSLISWRRQWQKAAHWRARLGFFESAVDRLRAGLIALNDEDANVWMNATASRLLKRTAADLELDGWFDALPVADLARLRTLIGRVRSTGEAESVVCGRKKEAVAGMEVEIIPLQPAQSGTEMAVLLIFREAA